MINYYHHSLRIRYISPLHRLSNAADLVQLYHMMHADCKSKTLNVDQNQHIEFIKVEFYVPSRNLYFVLAD